MVHAIQKLIIPPLLKCIWIKEIKGIDNIPSDGRFVATPNHSSYFDDWIVPSIIIPHLDKKLHMYVNRSYFKNPLSRWYLEHTKAIPVEVHQSKNRKKINENAFKKALYYLKHKEPIGIYPEGHRTLDGKLQKAKPGAARLALAAKVPVLPIGVIGTFDLLPKGKVAPKFKKCVIVKIGKPLYFKKYYGKEDNKKVLEKVTREIMKNIGKLTRQKYNY
ncbi:MAG: Acyltransferase family protein [Candidatus Nomurabacteria bacterium GW2011_GWA2_40_9]|uniref:Acyltransferase family protein n=1 Tax=Candidatus Nomurabacteria bacterium GW2011_GWA2_40_9 TaxID=1618734 RepID=A0A0G0TUJ1_9BACT|nr:MAG: Acyltransferase family protein [Candidatus Nomurabacteria bacterium GW2011_GWA2_40_9]